MVVVAVGVGVAVAAASVSASASVLVLAPVCRVSAVVLVVSAGVVDSDEGVCFTEPEGTGVR